MAKPKLVIMAAGLGSRYGGLKQISPVDDEGHIIIDFSIYDAVRAGFESIVCIIKPELERDFREAIGDRLAPFVKIGYAYQVLDMLPEGFRLPEGREKPWGTGHAVLCAKDLIDGPFAAINADDFYGRGAFQAIYDFLVQPGDAREHAMVGYRLENTLTENGYVSRGCCKVGADGYLSEIIERVRIEPREGGAAFTEDDGHTYTFLPADTVVSMNLWGFKPSILTEGEARFKAFLAERLIKDPLRCEYYLPGIPNAVIAEGRGRVRVLPTAEKWFGITYPGDMAAVREAIAEKKRAGEYPARLWN
ncbi:MAG: nucleotidyltransferase [Clostridiales bacterium]|nr:nucleotidyltransferase [Clostridiales bacterium]